MNAKPPAGLGKPGSDLWKSITRDYDLGRHELVVLEHAARTQDRIAGLRALIDRDGYVTVDDRGTVRTHPAVQECRLQEAASARLLKQLALPDLDEGDQDQEQPAPKTARQRAALVANEARWSRVRRETGKLPRSATGTSWRRPQVRVQDFDGETGS